MEFHQPHYFPAIGAPRSSPNAGRGHFAQNKVAGMDNPYAPENSGNCESLIVARI